MKIDKGKGKRIWSLILAAFMVIGTLFTTGANPVFAADEPSVGIAVKVVDENGDTLPGATFNVEIDGNTYTTGQSDSDGVAKTADNILTLHENGYSINSQIKITANTLPDGYATVEFIGSGGVGFSGSLGTDSLTTRRGSSYWVWNSNENVNYAPIPVLSAGDYVEGIASNSNMGSAQSGWDLIIFKAKKETYIDLLINKTDEDTDEPLANVEFTVTNNETDEVVGTITTGTDGTGSLKDLPDQYTYTITETKNPNAEYEVPSYTKEFSKTDADNPKFEEDNPQVSLRITNKKIQYGELQVYKCDSNSANGNNYPLEGAGFKLINKGTEAVTLKDGTVVEPEAMYDQEFITGADGYAKTGEILPVGSKFAFVETTYPEGYVKSGSQSDETDPATVTEEAQINQRKNARDMAIIQIYKNVYPNLLNGSTFSGETFEFDIELTDKEGNPVSGTFYYSIYSEDKAVESWDYPKYYKDADNADAKKITFTDGKATLSMDISSSNDNYMRMREQITIFDLPAGGNVTMKEKEKDGWFTSMAGYTDADWNETYEAEIATGILQESVDIKFHNSEKAKVEVSLEASKIVEGDTLEKGDYSFELKDTDGKVIATATNDENGKITFDAFEIPWEALSRTYINGEDATPEQKQTIRYWYDYNHSSDIYADFNDENLENAYGYYQGNKIAYANAKDEEKENIRYWLVEDSNGNRKEIWKYTEDSSRFEYLYTNVFEGDFEYTISEVKGSDPTITYDEHEETVKVHVFYVEGQKGGPEITVTYDEDGALFTNIYTKANTHEEEDETPVKGDEPKKNDEPTNDEPKKDEETVQQKNPDNDEIITEEQPEQDETETTEPGQKKDKDKSPATGVEDHMALYSGMLILSLLGSILGIFFRRRRI